MTAISKERMKIMNRRITMSVMTLGLLLGLARVSHGQTVEGCTTASFSQPAGSPVGAGDGPQSVAVGDFNLDGTPDLAVANLNSDNVTILLGNGMGGFTPTAGSPVGAGDSPLSVAVGDFNLDGRPDLVTANFNSHNVTILLGDGMGGFTHPSSSPVDVGDSPRSVAVGDFNRDGRSDLAVANDGGDNNVTILLSFVGVGPVGGGFTEPSGSPVGAGTNPESVAVGDLNPVTDSRPDLAVANGGDNNVTILLGVPPPLGMGGFAPVGPFGVGAFPFSVAVGNFNLVTDSWSDLAVANSGDNNVTILLGDGIGNFTHPSGSPVGVGDTPLSVAVGDFNLDGTPDLAVANSGDNNVTILLGDGMGGFTEPSGSPVGTGTNPQSVAVGDFNLDGRPDLAVANFDTDDVTILVNTCSNAPLTDTLPPVVTLRPAIELWPPNHKSHIITIAQMVQSVSDDSDGNLFNNVVIERVASDEPDEASRKADGTTINDIVIAGDCTSVRLRAERDGKKNGRVYSVTLRVGDSSGNVARREFKVSVPHDRGAPAVEDATAMTITSNCT
jgi:hypothetical protein